MEMKAFVINVIEKNAKTPIETCISTETKLVIVMQF